MESTNHATSNTYKIKQSSDISAATLQKESNFSKRISYFSSLTSKDENKSVSPLTQEVAFDQTAAKSSNDISPNLYHKSQLFRSRKLLAPSLSSPPLSKQASNRYIENTGKRLTTNSKLSNNQNLTERVETVITKEKPATSYSGRI